MFSKDQCIEALTTKGYSKEEIMKQMQLMINHMQSVKIGKETLNCVYNGKTEWMAKNNSQDLDDYLYSISSIKASFSSKPATKKKALSFITLCKDCQYKDTNRCPAYDAPMNRTSLRIQFCDCGESSKKTVSKLDDLIKKMKPEHILANKTMMEQLLKLLPDWAEDVLSRHQCIAIFTTLCFINDLEPDTKNYDDLVWYLFKDAELDKSRKLVQFHAFDLAMGQYLS